MLLNLCFLLLYFSNLIIMFLFLLITFIQLVNKILNFLTICTNFNKSSIISNTIYFIFLNFNYNNWNKGIKLINLLNIIASNIIKLIIEYHSIFIWINIYYTYSYTLCSKLNYLSYMCLLFLYLFCICLEQYYSII